MIDNRLSQFGYKDLSCLALEVIEKKEADKDNQLKEKIEEEFPKLRAVGFLYKDRNRLTKKGIEHLKEAIIYAREENRSALRYTGILMGFILAFFGLLMSGVEYENFYALLFIYLLSLLFGLIVMTLLAGFCFWHGCSRNHEWEELRVLNEMGDAIIIFSGWILLYTVYLSMYLSFSNSKFLLETASIVDMSKNLSIFYFLIPFIVGIIMVFLSWRASKRENGLKPNNIRNVIYEFLYTSTFLLSKGKKFYSSTDGKFHLGWFILIGLLILFSAFPIIILNLLK